MIQSTLDKMNILEAYSGMDTLIHRLHPLTKVLTTLIYLVFLATFDRYTVGQLLPFVLFPMVILILSDIPLWPIVYRVFFVLPLALGIGIMQPFFDSHTFMIAGYTFSKGWLTFFSIVLKTLWMVTATLLLIATTGMENIAKALRMMKVPKSFVLQLILTYRYIGVLGDEVSRMLSAYSMKAPRHKGLHHTVWGSFMGHLILRTYDRGQRIYQSMILKGFDGEYMAGGEGHFTLMDYAYLILWSLLFLIMRTVDIPYRLGQLFLGG